MKPLRGVKGSCSTGKRRFQAQYYAKVALSTAVRDRSPKRAEQRIYQCPRCAGWHLTSMGKAPK